MQQPVNLFFMGKGGVGKSTSSALISLYLARKGARVLLVSLDPAHNLSDIFEQPLTHTACRVTNGLDAVEIDQDRWIKAYLKQVHRQVKGSYRYLTAFNMDKYFSVLRHSPGLEEYAMIMAFEDIQSRFSTCDYLVFDMPPTALSLKFFSLPGLSLTWIGQLLSLRREIIDRKDIITRIRLGRKEFERDKVLNRIEQMKHQYEGLEHQFQDADQTRINLVLNPDRLSAAESGRIFDSLSGIGIGIHRMIVNKCGSDTILPMISRISEPDSVISLPFRDSPLTGMAALNRFVSDHEQQLNRIVRDR